MKLVITDITDFKAIIEGEHTIIQPKKEIQPCVGCFGCWVKTPGKCVIHDGYEGTGIALSKCEDLILVSRCCYGSLSPFVKTVLDRAISYMHPDFVLRNGEMHHKRRYKNVISLSAYLYGEDMTREEIETAQGILQANAENYDGELKSVLFYKTARELEGLLI